MLDRWLKNARGAEVLEPVGPLPAPTPTNMYFFCIISAGRGMISAETMAELEARRLLRLFSRA